MFNNLKGKIKDLAYSAVKIAEETLSTASGQEKEEAAIEYVISMLPVASVFKGVISSILTKFIQESVKNAYEYMTSIQTSEA